MSKKDRIAVVVSIIYFIPAFTIGASEEFLAGVFFGFSPLAIYWGYRFIQNDISFLNVKDAED